MAERADDQQQQRERPEAVPAIVEAQVESARAQVFRAYVRSREQARRLADEELGDAAGEQRRAS